VALGARACMTGRAYLYALGAGGERGVDRLLGWFDESIHRSLALIGCPSIERLSPDFVRWRQS